jgi:hypothetical protein
VVAVVSGLPIWDEVNQEGRGEADYARAHVLCNLNALRMQNGDDGADYGDNRLAICLHDFSFVIGVPALSASGTYFCGTISAPQL